MSRTLNQAGHSDPNLGITKIRRLPVKFIAKLCDVASSDFKMKSNLDSLAVANLGVLVYQMGASMSGGDNEDSAISIYDFLPYPEETDRKLKISRKGREILKDVIRKNIVGTKLIPLIAKRR